MPLRKIEVQGTTESEWVSKIEVYVPEAVINQDDPDALSSWVELNVDFSSILKSSEILTNSHAQTGADLINEEFGKTD